MLSTDRFRSFSAICAIAMFVIACSHEWARGASPSPERLLASYKSWLASTARATFRVDCVARYQGFALPAGTPIQESTHIVWRDGDRWKLQMHDTFRYPRRGQVATGEDVSERIYTNNSSFMVIQDPAKHVIRGVVANLDELPESQRRQTYSYKHGAVYGYLDGNDGLLLPAVLEDSTLTAHFEVHNGRQVQVLDAEGKWGIHAVWLDPAAGYIPCRIEQHKVGKDLLRADMPLTSYVGDGRFWPKHACNAMHRTVEVTKTQSYSGTTFPVAMTLVDEERFDKDQTVTVTTEIRFAHVNLRPDFSSANPFIVSTPIPNGTPVQVDDHPGINYEWRDGNIVKSMSQAALANLNDGKLASSAYPLGTKLMVALGLVALALLTFLFCSRLRSKRS
jgi:hypothetical protein